MGGRRIITLFIFVIMVTTMFAGVISISSENGKTGIKVIRQSRLSDICNETYSYPDGIYKSNWGVKGWYNIGNFGSSSLSNLIGQNIYVSPVPHFAFLD